jgi:uncharacterized membrane protein
MPTVEVSVVIAREPEDVFDFLIEAANLPVWDSSVVSTEQLGDDPVRVGTQTKGVSKVLGRSFTWTSELTELERPTLAKYTTIDGPINFVVTNLLEAHQDGTRYTYRIDAESGLGGVFGRLADSFIASAQTRTVRANLANLAELLAHQSAAAD